MLTVNPVAVWLQCGACVCKQLVSACTRLDPPFAARLQGWLLWLVSPDSQASHRRWTGLRRQGRLHRPGGTCSSPSPASRSSILKMHESSNCFLCLLHWYRVVYKAAAHDWRAGRPAAFTIHAPVPHTAFAMLCLAPTGRCRFWSCSSWPARTRPPSWQRCARCRQPSWKTLRLPTHPSSR